MTKIEITKEDIEKILNENLGVKYWELELGIGLQYEYQEGDIKFSLHILKWARNCGKRLNLNFMKSYVIESKKILKNGQKS